ncbi:MAG TPA: ABC transporter substrate-binding protein [Trebonia sp.]|jgi:NitT/TauT family transport system substrate-binding protein|nr:ABC transporter substrate-binding protein [Trebonia sp.]
MGLAVVALAASLAACSSSGGDSSSGAASGTADGKSLTSITVATPGPSSAFGFLWVAQDEGIFAKFGLNVKLETVSNSAQVPGLEKGSFQFIPQSGTTERAALQGLGVVNVLSALTNATSALVVSPGISSLADLKGKTIATASAISTPTLLAKAFLAKNGLSSVKLLSLQTEQAQETAFTSGKVDGLFLNLDSVVKAQGQVPGSKILVTPEDMNVAPGAQAGLGTSKSFLQSNSATVQAMIGASLEATKFSLENPTQTIAIYAKEFGVTTADATTIYNEIKPYIVLQATPTDTELQANATSDSKSADKTVTLGDVEKAWDTTLAQQEFKALNCPDVCTKS